MPRAIKECPQCGEPVSPFAAGCAICGADLEAARAARAARRAPALPRIGGRLNRTKIDWVHVAVAAVVALAAPPLGLLLALYWAIQRHRSGEPLMAGAMLAAAALAAAALVAPVWFWSHLLHI